MVKICKRKVCRFLVIDSLAVYTGSFAARIGLDTLCSEKNTLSRFLLHFTGKC